MGVLLGRVHYLALEEILTISVTATHGDRIVENIFFKKAAKCHSTKSNTMFTIHAFAK